LPVNVSQSLTIAIFSPGKPRTPHRNASRILNLLFFLRERERERESKTLNRIIIIKMREKETG